MEIIQEPLAGLRVLIVDDDADILDTLGTALKAAGADTLEVERAQTALDSMPSFKPDVVVTDLAMPVMSGVALVRELRRATGASASLPIIAVTAYADVYRPALPEAGFDRVMTKPLSPHDLVRTVMELTGNRRRGRRP
jgi:CheY-like chemotaxis protein